MISAVHWRFALVTLAVALTARAVHAGYEAPCYIDGCQSIDGRFVVTAQQVEKGKTVHGPHKWTFTWKDNKTGETKTIPAAAVQGGQIYAHLYIAPDGETFALWNHVTMYWNPKSSMHASANLPPRAETDEWRQQEVFSHRLIIYRKDGTVVKSLSVHDLLLPEEWEGVLPVFNRVHWIREYDHMKFKQTLRSGFAFTRVSPDYTILEFQPVSSRAKRNQPPRAVRVSLTDGRILAADEKLTDVNKIPVQPFQGDAHFPTNETPVREGYVPSLDPVRTPGKFTVQPTIPTTDETKTSAIAPAVSSVATASPTALGSNCSYTGTTTIVGGQQQLAAAVPAPTEPPPAPAISQQQHFIAAKAKFAASSLTAGEPVVIKSGMKKADTPAWLPSEKCLLFTDLDQMKLFRFDAPDKITVVREEPCRGKIGSDGRFYGILGGALSSWKPGEEPQVIAAKAAEGREFSLNDIAIGQRGFIYYSTLKDPDKGRLSVVDMAKGEVRVLFDGEKIIEMSNPNGVALSPDGKFLYVGISNYAQRKFSGVYRFTVADDGSIDFEAGRAQPWAAVQAPDGIAVDTDGSVYVTAGSQIHVYSPDAKPLGKIKIPKGSGTNLSFGGDDGRTLYVTTFTNLYAIPLAPQAAAQPQ